MFPKEAQGVTLVMISSAFVSANLFASKIIESHSWPYFHTMGIVCWLNASCCAVILLLLAGRRGFRCGKNVATWVFLRGTFGTGRFVLGILAALAGCPAGDVAALGSVNTVVAALLGRAFLREALGWPSICGVCLSIVGSVLISDPWSESGPEAGPHARGTTWLGFALALLAGASMGCLFIASRKTPRASPWLMTVSAMGQQGAVWWLLAGASATDGYGMEDFVASPEIAVALVLSLMVLTFSGSFLASAGAKLCPAAISATVYTATSMVTNYAGQILIFEQSPKALTLAGASAMLLAVAAISMDRLMPVANGTSKGLLEPLANSGGARGGCHFPSVLWWPEVNGDWGDLAP